MGLLIHDLSSEEWTRVSREYDGWDIVSDNGSMRNKDGNSAKLAKQLAARLEKEAEFVDLKDWLKDLPGLVKKLENASAIVFCILLYVDGLPSQVVRLQVS